MNEPIDASSIRYDSPSSRRSWPLIATAVLLGAIISDQVLAAPPAHGGMSIADPSIILAADVKTTPADSFGYLDLISTPSPSAVAPLPWNNEPTKNPPKFYYANPQRPYMRRLKEDYKLDEMVAGASSDLQRTAIICDWVHRQWEHKGTAEIKTNDPIAILEAARYGSQFNCHGYAAVTAGCLGALGFKARTVVLLPKDVESRPDGNYHVVAEVYLNDRKKWVMVDAQWNAIPTLRGFPLNLVELQYAIARDLPGLDFGGLREDMLDAYPSNMAVYLHFMETPIDNRVIGATTPGMVDGGVMLVPNGYKAPKTFARAPIGNFVVTRSVADFYGSVLK